MAIVGCCRNEVTAIRNVLSKPPMPLWVVVDTLAMAEKSGCVLVFGVRRETGKE